MNTRTRNLAAGALACAGLVFLILRPAIPATPQTAGTTPLGDPPTPSRAAPGPATSPRRNPAPSNNAPSFRTDRHPRYLVSHAIATSRLDGFPPDAAPGDIFDIWVAWDPPLTKQPRVHPLLTGVTLEKIAPPVTPDGPYVAILLVGRHQVSDLLYGSRYGALSVTRPAR